MHTFTALYATRQEAEAVKAELMQLGVIERDGILIGDHTTDGFSPQRDGDSRGFWDSFKNMFVSHADRPVYEEGVRQGGFLLMANVDEAHEGRVHDLLERSNALNVDEREHHYRSTGVLPLTSTAGATAARMQQGRATGQEPLREGTRQMARGGERVRSYVAEAPGQEHTPGGWVRRAS